MTYLFNKETEFEKDGYAMSAVLDWASEAPDRRIHIVSKHTKKGELKWYVRLKSSEIAIVNGWRHWNPISTFAVSPHLHIALQTALERWVKEAET